MWSTTVTATTSAAPDVVWSLLADTSRWPEWDSDVAEITGTIAPGARLRTRTRAGGTVRLKVVALEPGRCLADRQHLPLARVTVRRSVEPATEGSTIAFAVQFSGLLGRLWGRVLGRRVVDALKVQARRLAAASEQAQI